MYHLGVQIERRAYAKVNLALAVGPPQKPDATTGTPGLHPIASWMHALDLFDTVQVEWLGEYHPGGFEVVWAPDAPRPSTIDWPPEKDLALRAVRLVEQFAGRSLPVRVRIEKRIPVGGGLGGGSSDAAAVLVCLRDLVTVNLSHGHLAGLSSRLGSDVAYFIDEAPPRPALVTGLGDRIERLPRRLAGRSIVLVMPGFGCATGPVYKAFDALPPREMRERDVAALAAGQATGALFNDLLPAAERVQPALIPLREQVQRLIDAPVYMSGSGSTLFALPEGPADEAAAKIAAQMTDISVLVTRLI